MARYIGGMVLSRLRKLLIVFALTVLALPALVLPGLAQDSSSVYSTQKQPSGGALDWLIGRGNRPNAKIIRVTPDRHTRTYQPRRRSTPVYRPSYQPDRPVTIQPEAAPTPGAPHPDTPDIAVAPPPAPVVPPASIAVIGDSLSIFLAQGLQETYAERPSVSFIRRNRESSGLVRDDYYDWPKQLRDLIATTPKLDAILIQIGSNDRQQLRDADGVHEPRSDRWRELYAKRIDDIIAIVREKKIPLIWVGLPPMRNTRYSDDLLAFNDMYKTRTKAAGVPFIELSEAFSGEDGAYAVNGPDVEGSSVRLRTADGVHFTKAGARKLAFFADKELKKIIEAVQDKASPAPAPAIAALPVPGVPGALPSPPTLPDPVLPSALQSNDALLGVPVPDAPLSTTLTPRPAQGAVISLNAAPVSSGGQLLRVGNAAANTDSLRQGLPQPPKPGRADDFRVLP